MRVPRLKYGSILYSILPFVYLWRREKRMDSVFLWNLSKPLAVGACIAMASTYVGLLYAPHILLRLPAPISVKEHMLRRFVCAAVASVFAIIISLILLPLWMKLFDSLYLLLGVGFIHQRGLGLSKDTYYISLQYIRSSNGPSGMTREMDSCLMQGLNWNFMFLKQWQAVFFPLLLTALLYLGPLVIAALDVINEWKQEQVLSGSGGGGLFKSAYRKVARDTLSMGLDVLAWRNYVVAPLTEELVFRACMIPLLLCGGFQPYTVIFLCPVFFSLAHLNHFWELCYQQSYDVWRAALIVGLQLGYTTIFGWYAAFLFIRTGHLIAPIVAHTFCNFMGLPNISCILRRRVTTIIFVIGIAGFFMMLVPATYPVLYNESTDNCRCLHGFCKWTPEIV